MIKPEDRLIAVMDNFAYRTKRLACAHGHVKSVGCLLLCALLCVQGCQQQMAEQPYYRPLDESRFFEDGRSSRHPVAGTVAQGESSMDREAQSALKAAAKPRTAETSGEEVSKADAKLGAQAASPTVSSLPSGEVALTVARTDLAEKPYVNEIPFPLSEPVVRHGQQRYQVFCMPCHDGLGTGRGVVVERGFTEAPSYHTERLREAPLGYFFDVITRGYGSMPAYGAQIVPRERWEIVAYLRALQLSRYAPLDELREKERAKALAELERQGGK